MIATAMIYGLILLFFAHLVGDFWLQTRWMGEGKSKHWLPLLSHIAIYTIVLAVLSYPLHNSYCWWVYFVALNGFAHLITDAYTSQLGRYFYEQGNMKGFWTVIGTDQFIHSACLIASAGALLK